MIVSLVRTTWVFWMGLHIHRKEGDGDEGKWDESEGKVDGEGIWEKSRKAVSK